MTERKNYKPPFLLGEEMEGYAIGSVQKSKDSQFKEGDVVFSNFGMRDNFVCKGGDLKKIKNGKMIIVKLILVVPHLWINYIQNHILDIYLQSMNILEKKLQLFIILDFTVGLLKSARLLLMKVDF